MYSTHAIVYQWMRGGQTAPKKPKKPKKPKPLWFVLFMWFWFVLTLWNLPGAFRESFGI